MSISDDHFRNFENGFWLKPFQTFLASVANLKKFIRVALVYYEFLPSTLSTNYTIVKILTEHNLEYITTLKEDLTLTRGQILMQEKTS